MRSNKGLAGKRTRYIKQDLDSKGKILKSSHVIKGTDNWQANVFRGEVINTLRFHLAIRNIIIVTLIALLIMWR